MKNEIPTNENNEQFKDLDHSKAVVRLSAKSKDIKAKLKFKYLIYKLERSCLKNKYI